MTKDRGSHETVYGKLGTTAIMGFDFYHFGWGGK